MTRDWRPIDDMRLSDKDTNCSKTMNTHLHIIEPEQRLIAQHLCGLEQKPRGLYVVTVGDVGVDTVPVIIEKETEMMRAAVFHDVKEYMHQVHDIGAQAFVGPHTVEIGIWLNDVP